MPGKKAEDRCVSTGLGIVEILVSRSSDEQPHRGNTHEEMKPDGPDSVQGNGCDRERKNNKMQSVDAAEKG